METHAFEDILGEVNNDIPRIIAWILAFHGCPHAFIHKGRLFLADGVASILRPHAPSTDSNRPTANAGWGLRLAAMALTTELWAVSASSRYLPIVEAVSIVDGRERARGAWPLIGSRLNRRMSGSQQPLQSFHKLRNRWLISRSQTQKLIYLPAQARAGQ